MATLLAAHALLVPLTYVGLVSYLIWLVVALVRRDLPLHRRLLLTGAIAIQLARWL